MPLQPLKIALLIVYFSFFQKKIAFGQHVDANGQINFAGADMAGSSYLPGEAVFLPASMAAASEAAAAAFSQPDLPPVAQACTNVQLDPASSNVPLSKKGTAKSKTSGKKAKQGGNGVVNITPTTSNVLPVAAAVAASAGQPLELDEQPMVACSAPGPAGGASTNPDILQFQPVVDPNAAAAAAAVGMQPLEVFISVFVRIGTLFILF